MKKKDQIVQDAAAIDKELSLVCNAAPTDLDSCQCGSSWLPEKIVKCRNKAQNTHQTCNDVVFNDCEDCPVLCSWDAGAGLYVRCNNAVPIKFGETVEHPERVCPCHLRKDKYA